MPSLGNSTFLDNDQSVTNHDKQALLLFFLIGTGLLLAIVATRACMHHTCAIRKKPDIIPSLDNSTKPKNPNPPDNYSLNQTVTHYQKKPS
jgi:hypothetical protein